MHASPGYSSPATLPVFTVLLLLSLTCRSFCVDVQTADAFLENIAAGEYKTVININSSISLRDEDVWTFPRYQRKNLTITGRPPTTVDSWISVNLDAGQRSAPYSPINASCSVEISGLILSNVCLGYPRTMERVSRPNLELFVNTLADNASPDFLSTAPR